MGSWIQIAARLRPFSHRPGTCCLIPGTDAVVEAYPALVYLKELDGTIIKEIPLEIEGPLKRFTVMQDLERGCVTIFSECYHFHILPDGEVKQSKNCGLPPLPIEERLSLGSHKKQEWEGIHKRRNPCEFFPLWFRLGSLYDLPKRSSADEGVFSLLKACREVIEAHRPEHIVPAFEKLFLAGFGGLLIPRLTDQEHQGILPHDAPTVDASALYLLSEGAELIRSLFVKAAANQITILPNLPPEFFAGRLCKAAIYPFGELDLEWSKKMIRRVVFRARCDGELFFRFRSSIRSYRLRRSVGERGETYSSGEPLVLKAGSAYLLDQFQK